MTEEEENRQWREAGCRYSPLDNDALSRYFEVIAKLDPAKKTEVVAAFDKAIGEGWRPKFAVKRALTLVDSER